MRHVEQALKLKASQIPHRGMLKLTLNGRNFGVNATPESVSIVSGKFAQRIERIKVLYGGRSHGGFTLWFKCPVCGRKTTTLYLPLGGVRFACRHCHRLTYEAWRKDGRHRWPKTPHLWIREFLKRGAKILRKSKSGGE